MSKNSLKLYNGEGTEKSFGVLFSIVFLVIALYPLSASEDPYIWAFIVSGVFLLLAFVAPKTLFFFNKLWFKFGILLGSIIAPIVMALIYLTTVLPTGIIMRILGKDLLRKRFDKSANSYWIERRISMGSMKNQF